MCSLNIRKIVFISGIQNVIARVGSGSIPLPGITLYPMETKKPDFLAMTSSLVVSMPPSAVVMFFYGMKRKECHVFRADMGTFVICTYCMSGILQDRDTAGSLLNGIQVCGCACIMDRYDELGPAGYEP
jgi:hypothetical protein